jgi:predicted RNA binding protein YcfA (HicA-like mRNA interferase family)
LSAECNVKVLNAVKGLTKCQVSVEFVYPLRVAKHEKTKEAVLSGTSNANIQFDDLCHLLEKLGFTRKQGKGSHVKFVHRHPDAILVLQEGSSGKAKPYQVKQVAEVILQNKF